MKSRKGSKCLVLIYDGYKKMRTFIIFFAELSGMLSLIQVDDNG